MKPVIRFLFVVMYMTFMIACNKTDQLINVSKEMDLKSAPIECQVITVLPSGYDDTEALQQAFDDALPGSVVQLGEGTYYLDFIEIREFNGTFRGAGKGKTVITTVADVSVDALIAQKLNTVLIRFVEGDILLSDMTIKTPHGALSNGSESRIDGLLGFSAYTYQTYKNRTGNEYINAIINNVDFIGNLENCGYGLKAEFGVRSSDVPPTDKYLLSKTNITITNCKFENFLYSGALIWHIKDGKINVGTKNNGNVFNNIEAYQTNTSVGYGSLGIWMNVNVEISVVDNTFQLDYERDFGVDLWRAPYESFLEKVPQTKATICNIERNVFNVTGGAGGIKMNDRRRYFYPSEAPMLVQVKNNQFNMSNQADAGIECVCMSGTVIRNNKFTGTGSYGVLIMTDGLFRESKQNYNENGLMLGNNFSNTTYSVAAAFDKSIKNVILSGSLISYSSVAMNRFYRIGLTEREGGGTHHPYEVGFSWGIAGVLKGYDLPDLIACISPRKVILTNLKNQMLEPASDKLIETEIEFPQSVYKSQGFSENLRVLTESPDLLTLLRWCFN